jgi:hypothetical protein
LCARITLALCGSQNLTSEHAVDPDSLRELVLTGPCAWYLERYACRSSLLESCHVAPHTARLAFKRHGVRLGQFGAKWCGTESDRLQRKSHEYTNTASAKRRIEVVRLRDQASLFGRSRRRPFASVHHLGRLQGRCEASCTQATTISYKRNSTQKPQLLPRHTQDQRFNPPHPSHKRLYALPDLAQHRAVCERLAHSG